MSFLNVNSFFLIFEAKSCYCIYNDLRVNGGVGMTTGDPEYRLDTSFTFDSCLEACTSYSLDICYAFDFNIDHNTCHVHLSGYHTIY